MQLRMTAPMDIGMDQADVALRAGQDDIFELDDAKALHGKDARAGFDGGDSDDDDARENAEGDDDVEMLDSEEERERKLAGLEAELDGMYEAYQEHLKERDAKYKVNEARKNSKAHEEWTGFGKAGGSDDDGDDSDVADGGWDKVQRAKARVGEEESSDEESDEESGEEMDVRVAGKKRRHVEEVGAAALKSKKPRTVATIQPSKPGAPLSRSAQLWFDQDLFAGADAAIEDDEDDEGGEEQDADNDASAENWVSEGGEEVGAACYPSVVRYSTFLFHSPGCVERKRRRPRRLRGRPKRSG